MRPSSLIFSLRWSIFISLLLGLSSCMTYRDIVNFQDGQDLRDGVIDTITNYTRWTVQPEDILQITVYSSNVTEARRFNLMDNNAVFQMQQQGAGGISEPMGYRVNTAGMIDLPVIGQVMAKDRTLEEIKNEVQEKIAATGYLPDVSVQVIFLSFRITILGEVNGPRSYIVRSEKVNILEAIGMAGDVTFFSNRENILIIREKKGVRNYGRINLKSRDLFKSPYFYLQPNDVVYVEPHKAKIMAAPDPVSRYLSVVVGVVSFITLIISFAN
jgi:polysaccharide export outer membrane protein